MQEFVSGCGSRRAYRDTRRYLRSHLVLLRWFDGCLGCLCLGVFLGDGGVLILQIKRISTLWEKASLKNPVACAHCSKIFAGITGATSLLTSCLSSTAATTGSGFFSSTAATSSADPSWCRCWGERHQEPLDTNAICMPRVTKTGHRQKIARNAPTHLLFSGCLGGGLCVGLLRGTRRHLILLKTLQGERKKRGEDLGVHQEPPSAVTKLTGLSSTGSASAA